MYLAYFDEVKIKQPDQKNFIMGAVVLDIELAQAVEDKLNLIATNYFGNCVLNIATEFHASHIFQGKGPYKGLPMSSRMKLLQDLVQIFVDHNDIHRIFIEIVPENIVATSKDPQDVGFMYLVEQVDQLLGGLSSKGVIFGDYDDPVIGSSVKSLSMFRQGGTYWERSKQINNLVDTVHFAHSHHSRLIQLADVWTYAVQFIRRGNTSSHYRQEFYEFIQSTNLLATSISKIWPSEAVWYHSSGIYRKDEE